ncbi:MAG TPA: threonine-phosphate decarboxylase CobD [Candidatus Udaeobacter sp.]|jgi:threonine-phosphate decarboxylase|nr:threonine-phosphate decarboxylase CobD [Candidatus Udaeobacter sp.]
MSGHGHSVARDFRPAVDREPVEPRLDREHGGDVFAWAQRVGIRAGDIVDFSASINPLGPPSLARKAFRTSYREISRYPDPYGAELKQALASRHEMEPEELLLGNGSTQLIYLLCLALRPRRALIVGPAFSEYANALKLAGARVRVSPAANDGFKFSTEEFMSAWEKDDDMVFLTTPNSLTGQLIPRAEIEKIARVALMREKFIIVDEAFIDFVETESVKRLVRENPYLIVLRSLTKYYALPGLRLGYLLAQAQRVKHLADYLEPWSVNGPALKVALACLKDMSFQCKTDYWLRRERSFLAKGLRALKGFHPYPSSANFLLVRIEHPNGDAGELRSFLLGKHLLIRVCNSFLGLGARYFRVAVRRRKDNQRLLHALREWPA